MKVFIFAIGGTGARVLRSFTLLLASGVKVNPDVEFIPVIIDMDITNGDTHRTKELIENYRIVRQAAYPAEPTEGFFSPKLKNLASYKANNFKGHIQDSFQLEFGNVDTTFYKYIKADDLNPENGYLLDSLFDNSPEPRTKEESSPTELHLNLSKGFKGNPNIGSIVFNELVTTDEYKYFEDICTEKDKIFIISSIFGGTGASGFPQLVKNLRNSDKNNVKNAQIGALVVMPYFIVARKNRSSIDSNNFNSKTKAALTYYASELDGLVNETYYIGNSDTGDAYDNHEGGEQQQNLAHMVEMISAMSILHFVKLNPPISQEGQLDFRKLGYHFYEYGVKKETADFDFRYFYPGSQNDVFMPLTTFTYLAKFFTDDMLKPIAQQSAFARALNLTSSRIKGDAFYGKLYSFLKDGYLKWLQEMAANKPGFSPYIMSENFKRMIREAEYKLEPRDLIDQFSKYEKKFKSIESEYERFIKLAYHAIQEEMNSKVKALPIKDFN